MLEAMIFGRLVEGRQTETGTQWRYSDGTVCATVGWTPDSFRYASTVKPCPECSEFPDPTGEDPCLGVLPGITSACCGHGELMEATAR